jgi:hypothetical protein
VWANLGHPFRNLEVLALAEGCSRHGATVQESQLRVESRILMGTGSYAAPRSRAAMPSDVNVGATTSVVFEPTDA